MSNYFKCLNIVVKSHSLSFLRKYVYKKDKALEII